MKKELNIISLHQNLTLTRKIKDIKLYSQFVFNYPTEIWQRHFSKYDILTDNEYTSEFSFEFKYIPLNSKQFRADRFNPKSCKFYFLDVFNEYVFFDFVELTIF